MNDVLPITRDAIRTLWSHKRLWALGLFVAAGANGVSADVPDGEAGITAGGIAAILIVGAITGAITFALHVISEGALIDAVRDERRGDVPALARAWRRGLSAAGAVLGLKLITWAATGVVLATALAPALLGVAGLVPRALGIALTVPLLVIAVPTAISLYLAHEVGLRMAVLERRGSIDALRGGLRFLRGRLRFALQLLVIDGVAQAIGGIVALPFALVGLAIGAAVYASAGLETAVVTGVLLLAPVALVVAGARGTFRSALWTHAVLDARPGAA